MLLLPVVDRRCPACGDPGKEARLLFNYRNQQRDSWRPFKNAHNHDVLAANFRRTSGRRLSCLFKGVDREYPKFVRRESDQVPDERAQVIS